MIKFLLYLLEKLPYRTSFGMTLANELKDIYYKKIGQFKKPERCLCGGIITTFTFRLNEDDVSWETTCQSCNFLVDED